MTFVSTRDRWCSVEEAHYTLDRPDLAWLVAYDRWYALEANSLVVAGWGKVVVRRRKRSFRQDSNLDQDRRIADVNPYPVHRCLLP